MRRYLNLLRASFALTGSFRMLGRFRVHHNLGNWHYSGTFFWMRHARVFSQSTNRRYDFYGSVEAWPGVHFGRDETGCLFLDNLRQLPYADEFWHTLGNTAFEQWQQSVRSTEEAAGQDRSASRSVATRAPPD